MKTKQLSIKLFLTFLSFFIFEIKGFSQEVLPQILTQAPSKKIEIIGSVSASKPHITEAKNELARQAKKLDAKAVILKSCEEGSIKREGLTWTKSQAFCEGTAIRFK